MNTINYENILKMRIIIIIVLIFQLSSCVDIIQQHPKTDYYSLKFYETDIGVGSQIPGTILIKDVEFPANLESIYLTSVSENSSIKKHHYHRWIDYPSVLVTDFIKSRFNSFEAFSGSVIGASSSIYPDYILEISIIKFDSYNTKAKNQVEISANVVLLHKTPESIETNVIFNKTFDETEAKEKMTANVIADAYSKALSRLIDNIAYDLQNTILKIER